MAAPPLWAVFVAICFSLLAGLCAWVFYISSPAPTIRKVARLGKREPLSDAEFFRAFYSTSGLPEAAVVKTLKFIADATQIPAGLIRPTDGLTAELARVKPWEPDEGGSTLKLELYKEEQKAGITLDYRNIRTVDDYIRTLAALRQGSVLPEIQYRPRFSENRIAVGTFLLNVLDVVVFLVLSSVLDRYETAGQFIAFGVLIAGFVLVLRWIKHEARRFEFGKSKR